ncbi:hypothetical protein ABW19_dt0206595 [Dactylella cylindrospora]|nr:hypothetical protein ABW19_dt0206595 [Dactylella cylindrospora]
MSGFSGFGQPTGTGAGFGQPTNTSFGQATTTGFGGSSTGTGFGAPAFGQATSGRSAFGAFGGSSVTVSGFGQPSTASPFGAPVVVKPAAAPKKEVKKKPVKDDSRSKPPRLFNLFNNEEFSDVKVITDQKADRREFHLHRAVICNSSAFFKAACKSNFREGIKKEITLPEMESDVFEYIGKWLYGQSLESENLKEDATLRIYQAADFLQIPELKQEILEKLTGDLEADIEKKSTKYESINKPLELVEGICRTATVSEWTTLQRIVRLAIAKDALTSKDLIEHAKGERDGAFFLPLLVGAYQKSITGAFCKHCLPKFWSSLEDSCNCFHCNVEIEQRPDSNEEK